MPDFVLWIWALGLSVLVTGIFRLTLIVQMQRNHNRK